MSPPPYCLNHALLASRIPRMSLSCSAAAPGTRRRTAAQGMYSTAMPVLSLRTLSSSVPASRKRGAFGRKLAVCQRLDYGSGLADWLAKEKKKWANSRRPPLGSPPVGEEGRLQTLSCSRMNSGGLDSPESVRATDDMHRRDRSIETRRTRGDNLSTVRR